MSEDVIPIDNLDTTKRYRVTMRYMVCGHCGEITPLTIAVLGKEDNDTARCVHCKKQLTYTSKSSYVSCLIYYQNGEWMTDEQSIIFCEGDALNESKSN